jgi:hypothetical protein
MSFHNVDDEFYMVLPSNSSPLTHPQNNAADYVVDWNTAIELDPNENWKVALTEVSYIYHPHTLSSNLGIEYEYFENQTTKASLAVKLSQTSTGTIAVVPHAKILGLAVNVSVKDKKYLIVTAAQHFTINDAVTGSIQGESSEIDNGRHHQLVGSKDLHDIMGTEKEKEIFIDISFHDIRPKVSEFRFPSDHTFTSSAQLYTYLKEKCKDIFSDVAAHSSGRSAKMAFFMANKVYRIKFTGGLNFVLGFYENEFKMVNPSQLRTAGDAMNPSTYQSDIAPQLNRGVKHMYIYASCCAPVYVGHTRVPLLKNIFVDASQDADIKGHVRNLSVQNPMYVNVAASLLNSIQINIRNDAGNIIAFPKGAITVLTLHFKKFSKW